METNVFALGHAPLIAADLTELYTWTHTQEDGIEQTLLVEVPVFGRVHLITRHRHIALDAFAELACQHQQDTGERVRLLRWTAPLNMREID